MSLSVEIQKQLGSFHLEVSFQTENELLALLGASGCGKSVTLRCIAGILTPDAGRIVLDGTPLFDSAAGVNLPPQRRQVGYLFQQYALFPNMTVRQNIAAAARRSSDREACVTELLRRFRLEEVSDLRPAQISGGQQQRCALARILASHPRLILLDEPLSALDSYLRFQLETELAETLERLQLPALWVSHDLREVYRTCRRVCVLADGRSQPVQTMEALVRRPTTEAAARLCGCENFADAVQSGPRLTIPQWGWSLELPAIQPTPIHRVGIRARCIHPWREGSPNAFSCRVERVTEDLSSAILLLRPDSALPGAPLLRMETEKASEYPAHLTVSLSPEDLLFLELS